MTAQNRGRDHDSTTFADQQLCLQTLGKLVDQHPDVVLVSPLVLEAELKEEEASVDPDGANVLVSSAQEASVGPDGARHPDVLVSSAEEARAVQCGGSSAEEASVAAADRPEEARAATLHEHAR